MLLDIITNASLVADLLMAAWTRPEHAVKTLEPRIVTQKLESKPSAAETLLKKEIVGLQSEKVNLEKKLALSEKKTRSQEQDMQVLCKILVLEKKERKQLQKELEKSEKKIEASLEAVRNSKMEFEMAIDQERNNLENFLEEFKQNITEETEAIIEKREKEAQEIKSELNELRRTVEKIKLEKMFLSNIVQAHEEKSADDTDMQWSRNLSEAAFYMTDTISSGNAFNYKGKQVWDKAVFL